MAPLSATALLVCPVCGSADVAAPASNDASPPSGALDSARVGSIRSKVHHTYVAVCRRCDLGWQPSTPPQGTLDAAYAGLVDEVYVAEELNRLRSAARAARLLVRHGVPSGGRVLDVGCSAGYFVEGALKLGFDATGLEPSGWLCDQARRRVGPGRILEGPFVSARFDTPFDAVTMWDVLEHVPDPLAFLAHARAALKPGGLLLINVPARDTWIAKMLGAKWPLLLPEHLFYFSRRSLTRAFESNGFDAPTFHSHIVFFSIRYVTHRLAQHEWPWVGGAARVLGRIEAPIPLLLGERTAVARRAAHG